MCLNFAGRKTKMDKNINVFSQLLPELSRAVSEAGYKTPSPIQAQSIPILLEGHDMIGCAQTGTGKTAAFTLPILQYLLKNKKRPVSRKPRVLIITPTRELAAQIRDSVAKYGKHTSISHTVIFGGVGQSPQVKALRNGVDILVATPGRLLDLMNQRHIDLSQIEIFVLDEADRMLDMGFFPDIKRVIAKLPKKKQSLFFSATMERKVVELARTLVRNPKHVTIEPEKLTLDIIEQKLMFVSKKNKDKLLVELLEDDDIKRVIVFVQMKHVANRVVLTLDKAGISSAAIHGNKSQTARTNALAKFKSGKIRVLVATDIAARGIDVDKITHVINYDLPGEPETYVHRIGRTARAGNDGAAISFCCATERGYLNAIERFIKSTITIDKKHSFHCEESQYATGTAAKPAQKRSRGKGNGFNRDRIGKKAAANRPFQKRKRT
jgi:ATP-dependent RNA helicase RhlE